MSTFQKAREAVISLASNMGDSPINPELDCDLGPIMDAIRLGEAERLDLQVFLEMVGKDGDGIVIEDGEVAAPVETPNMARASGAEDR